MCSSTTFPACSLDTAVLYERGQSVAGLLGLMLLR
ncbi:hypothetical protein M2281_003798 [Mesorhizobium soli]|nr:hypothetical protein [Mesorhizobium soli]